MSRVPTHIDRYSLLDASIQVKPRLPCLSSSTDGIWTATPGPGSITPCWSSLGVPPDHVDLVVQALGIDEPVRRGAGGHGRHQVPVAVLDLSGRRVREDGDGAAGLIGRCEACWYGVTGSDVYVKVGLLLR